VNAERKDDSRPSVFHLNTSERIKIVLTVMNR